MGNKIFYYTLRFILMPFIKLAYRLEVTGKINVPESGAFILCANHTSIIDPVLLFVLLKRQIFFMSKAELFENKLFSKILYMLGAFPVRRGEGDTTAIDTAKSILNKGELMGIFIEGTRSRTGVFLRPKTGAAMIAYHTGTKVIPICITNKNGGPVKILCKNVVFIGRPVSLEELEATDGTGKSFRTASRGIMEKIKDLRPNKINLT